MEDNFNKDSSIKNTISADGAGHGAGIKNNKSVISIIIIVAAGTFMSALDSSIVNISLPVISNNFSAPITSVEWVVLSYLIIITSLLLTFGKLGDLYGHKKIFNTGFAVFTAGSLFCSLSPSLLVLVIARVVQAFGAGMLMAMGPAIITINAPPKKRGRYLGIIAVSVSVALIAGPVLRDLKIILRVAEHFLCKYPLRDCSPYMGAKNPSFHKV